MDNKHNQLPKLLDRALIATLIFLVLLLMGIQVARAGEIIPSIGLSHSTANHDGEAKVFGGLAFRGNLAPLIKTEVGLAYRSESFANNDLTVRMWPLTASLWLTPMPTLYAGGGVGWYNTTLDYAKSTGFEDKTTQEFGVHLGGGLRVPIGPVAALDLNGRYVFLDQQASELPPNFWTYSGAWGGAWGAGWARARRSVIGRLLRMG